MLYQRLGPDKLWHIQMPIMGQSMYNWTPICRPNSDWKNVPWSWSDRNKAPTCLRCIAREFR